MSRLDPLDAERLRNLVAERDNCKGTRRAHYLQGRIDEYCAQNAIDQTDTDLDLKLPAEAE